ncbi:hypothetical protein LTR09_000789 [Extremus antarcticus]|uniref:Heterokaryon incompatibility domain-containing protein n=1 Tax=Extremus antarcticus TaxID=702011 RepID=A0AAJ0GKE4_9PEZI|nr:hypothetical protein LTR09_000789 [Extremus antarcticus]
MAHFQYSDSIDGDQIRILTLRPSSDPDSMVECQLTAYDRLTCRPYDALSYCWGESKERRSIFVNDLPFNIGVRLAEALHHLRLPDKDRILWTDAICINQESKVERTAQVKRMGDTYSGCFKTLVWLGPASEQDQSTVGMKAIDSIGGPLAGKNLMEVRTSMPRLPPSVLGRDIDTYLLAIRRILERKWFTRLWVVQEFCLAPQVDLVCGQDVIPLSHLTNMQLSLPWSPDMQSPTRYGLAFLLDPWLLSTRQLFQVTPKETPKIEELKLKTCSLLSNMWNSRARRCEEPKDRVYALLALSPDVSDVLIPDYDEPLAVTFIKTTRVILKRHQNLDLLFLCCGPDTSFVQNKEEENEKLPSWVPNYNANTVTAENNVWTLRPLNNYLPGSDRHFTATGSPFVPNDSDPLDQLTVSGYNLGTIDAVSSLGWGGGIQQAYQLVQEKLATSPATNMRETFWRTVISNRRHNSMPAEQAIEGSEFEGWWRAITNPDGVTDEETASRIAAADNYNRAYWQHGHQRLLFTTDTSFVGLSRAGIREGDHVCLLAGGQTPFVLRPCGREFQIVCEAYVHGIMDGGLWGGRKASEEPRTEFVLI